MKYEHFFKDGTKVDMSKFEEKPFGVIERKKISDEPIRYDCFLKCCTCQKVMKTTFWSDLWYEQGCIFLLEACASCKRKKPLKGNTVLLYSKPKGMSDDEYKLCVDTAIDLAREKLRDSVQ